MYHFIKSTDVFFILYFLITDFSESNTGLGAFLRQGQMHTRRIRTQETILVDAEMSPLSSPKLGISFFQSPVLQKDSVYRGYI